MESLVLHPMPSGEYPLQSAPPSGFPGLYPTAYGRAVSEKGNAPFPDAAGALVFAESGQGLLSQGSVDYEWNGLCLFAIKRPNLVRLYALEPLSYRYVLLAGRGLDDWLDYLGPYHILPPEGREIRLVDNYFRGLSSSQGRSFAAQATATYDLFCSLAEAFVSRPATYDALVENALGLIRQSYPTLEGLDDLCERLAVSKGHFIRVFRSALGCSPWQYVQDLRMEDAKLLLTHRDYNMDIVAHLVGFASANYFCKAFRKAAGTSPAAYKKRWQSQAAPSLYAQQRLRDIEIFGQL